MEKQITNYDAYFIYMVVYSCSATTISDLKDRTKILDGLFPVVNEYETQKLQINKEISNKNQQFNKNAKLVESLKPSDREAVDAIKENELIEEDMKKLAKKLKKLDSKFVDTIIYRQITRNIFKKKVHEFFGTDPINDNIKGNFDMKRYCNIYENILG